MAAPAAVILAAGEGKRMKSDRAKVLHEVLGRSLVGHVVHRALSAGASPVVVVVGVQGDAVRRHLEERFPGAPLEFVVQEERRGTADAVRRAVPALRRFRGDVFLLCGDVPALPVRALRDLLRHHRRRQASLTILTAELDDPTGYGRIVRDARGRVTAIVEHRDASPEQRRIREINSGTYCARWPDLAGVLDRIRADNAQGEYYLTDAVRELIADGKTVVARVHPVPGEVEGINSRRQLAAVAAILRDQVNGRLMDGGVTILDPATTWIDDTVRVGRDTVIHPGVTLEGTTRIGRGVTIRSGCRLAGTRVGDGTTVLDHVVATDARIGTSCSVGPFTHLRPGTDIRKGCKVGNFVEIKKSVLGEGTKASHLSYLGDATLGRGVNVGAGTITCNYDGEKKHPTILEDGVFIGSDTQLVAPVRVGKGAYVGAGATVTHDVPPGALAISRAPQKNIEGWVERRKQRKGGRSKKKKKK